jgi:hypothetical protein
LKKQIGFKGGYVYLTVIRWVFIFTLFVFSGSPGIADDREWNTAGLRAGINDNRNEEVFSKYEAYGTFSLPWKWSTEQGWNFGAFIGINAGMVICEDNAFIGSIGPGIYLITPTGGVVVTAGIYPTYIGKSTFGEEDFGASFQFTSAFGINLTFYRHWTMGYGFQHMSNGGISNENPGLNTHMLELGYRF